MWARIGRWILPEMPDFHVAFRDLLHAVNLRHGTDGFTSPPKEGALRTFSPWKIRRLRSGLNPRTWVPKASTLSLDHRSRLIFLLNWDYFPGQHCRLWWKNAVLTARYEIKFCILQATEFECWKDVLRLRQFAGARAACCGHSGTGTRLPVPTCAVSCQHHSANDTFSSSTHTFHISWPIRVNSVLRNTST
jgi:hypothetical protein